MTLVSTEEKHLGWALHSYRANNATKWTEAYPTNPALLVGIGYSKINRVPDPDWRQKVARREPASNPYIRAGFSNLKPALVTMEGRAYLTSSGSSYPYYYRNKYYGFAWSAAQIPYLDGANVNHEATRDIALAKIKGKLANHTREFNALVPLGEINDLRKTITATANSATQLIHTLMDIRKRYKNSAKWAAEAWLNWGFGIAPTLADTRNLVESIQTYLERSGHSARLRGACSTDWVEVSPERTGSFGSQFKLSCQRKIYHKISYEYTGAFDVFLSAANNYSMSDHLGFEWENVPSAAWELTPYSWLIDYFSTVGPFLEDIFSSPAGDLRYLTLQKKYNAHVQFDWKWTPNFPASAKVDTEKTPMASFDYFYFERQVCSSLPHRALRLKTVDEIGKNALNKVLNLASILVAGHAPYTRR